MNLVIGKDVATGEEVSMQVFHTLLAGQTNLAGKTTTARSLAFQAAEKLGFTVVGIDTKPTRRELAGFNDIPIPYRPTKDPLVVMPLLESVFQGRKLTKVYGVLLRIMERGEDLQDFANNAREYEENERSAWAKDAAHTIADLLTRLDKQLKGLDLASDLILKKGKVNVVAINHLSEEAQQLVIKTIFELALKKHNYKVIIYVDEGFKALPQKKGSACKSAVQDVITQGAATELFVWMGTQFLTTTEKDPMKAMPNKLLGRQDHDIEQDETLDLIGKKAGMTRETIRGLKKGEFIFVPLEGEIRKVYIYPPKQELQAQLVPVKTPARKPVLKRPRPIIKATSRPLLAPVETGIGPLELNEPDPEQLKVELSTPTVNVTLSKPQVELLNDKPQTTLGRVAVVLKRRQRNDGWFRKGIQQALADHGWPDDGLEDVIQEFLRVEILVDHGKNGFTCDRKRIEIVEEPSTWEVA